MSKHATLRDAILYFAEFENCRQFITQLRWPTGVVKCPECGAEKVTWLAKSRVWKCYANHPKPRFSLKTGTIFEDSPIALEKWLPAVWMLLNCKNGISSYELHRGLGVTQKTAWFMLQRIRLAMQEDLTGGMLSGEVEVDETFIGGKVRSMHKDRKLRAQIEHDHKRPKSVVLPEARHRWNLCFGRAIASGSGILTNRRFGSTIIRWMTFSDSRLVSTRLVAVA